MSNEHETRHPDWIKVDKVDGSVRKGDRVRIEYNVGAVKEATVAVETIAALDWRDEDFYDSSTYYVWRPESKPWEVIPKGNTAVMAISMDGREPVVGTYYRDGGAVRATLPTRLSYFACQTEHVTSATHVTAVPTDALNKLRAAWLDDGGTSVTVAEATDGFLAAVYEFDA